jgi:cytochrome b subunit of formate dehydrogenase
MSMSEARRNYWVDAAIGIAFLVVALSALVFLVPTSWIDFSASTTPTILGVDFGIWQTLHKWAGIVMLVGVVLHQLLHWKWIVAMTKKVLPRPKLPKREQRGSSQATVDG